MNKNTPNLDNIPYGYCHCGCGQKTGIAKRAKRSRNGYVYRKGEPFHFVKSHAGSNPRPLVRRFWEKVDKSGGDNACWNWTAAKTAAGYGVLRMPDKTNQYAHRIAYEWSIGPIPKGCYLCHHCDNPTCVNPSHMFVGEQIDNMRDAATKGRTTKGERSKQTTLTAEQVLALRAEYATGTVLQRELAARYNISRGSVGNIVRRESWKHI